MSFDITEIGAVADVKRLIKAWENKDDPAQGLEALKSIIKLTAAASPLPAPVKAVIREFFSGKGLADRGIEGAKELATKTDDALRGIDFPGTPPKDPTPPGMEWQPTITVSNDGHDFSQGPSYLVPEGTKSPNNQYYDPNGNRIYPPEGGWAHPTNPNQTVPDPKPYGDPLPKPSIDPRTKSAADAAKAALPPRVDPLTFDLDGDGLETTGVSATNPILFDHDADGIKTGTGWVSPDDAFLVIDKNGNGTIDTGRELFGDSTLKSNGQLARDGFDALADLDSVTNGGNGDGIVNASDAAFASLRLWRDLNQDGISQSNELFTLASQNIIGINVASTAHSQVLPNGNQLADTGSFIKGDGTQGQVGAVTGSLGDINLATDTFHRTFTTTLNTSSVATLPDMQACTGMFLSSGSGVVRDLCEAANDEDWRVVA